MENCARKRCLFQCTILFEVTWAFCRVWTPLFLLLNLSYYLFYDFFQIQLRGLSEVCLNEGLLADVTIKLDDGVLTAHKALLMARYWHFLRLLTISAPNFSKHVMAAFGQWVQGIFGILDTPSCSITICQNMFPLALNLPLFGIRNTFLQIEN